MNTSEFTTIRVRKSFAAKLAELANSRKEDNQSVLDRIIGKKVEEI